MKKSIKVILAGLLLVPMLALSVSLIAPSASAQSVCDPGSPTAGIDKGAECAKGNGQKEELFGVGGIFSIITNAALFLIGAISVIMLIYGGIRYTISGGDSSNVTAAKNTILYAIVGIVVALLSYAIVNFVIGKLITT